MDPRCGDLPTGIPGNPRWIPVPSATTLGRVAPRPEQALERLAAGGLRGPVDEAHALFEEAWPALTARLAVFQRALRVSEDLWEDCGQAALVRVWRARQGYAGGSLGELMSWLYTTCEREHLRLLERAGRRREEPLAVEDTDVLEGARSASDALEHDPTADAAARRDERLALEECLERLDQRHRSAVELLYASDGLTEREAAAVLACSKSRVHALRKEALQRLAHCLRAKGVE